MLCIFLAALDQVCSIHSSSRMVFTQDAQTIVATALPTIVSKLGGGSQYSWVGT